MASSMEIRVAGNQLVLSGRINGDEIARMRDVLPANPQIDTVVLKDSPGGDIWTAMRLGEMFEDRRFKTVVSGSCSSACVIVFLGGVERSFATAASRVGIHTPTYAAGDPVNGGRAFVQARGRMLDWMGPRVKDVALLESGLSNPNPAVMLYLSGAEALRAGFITSTTIMEPR